MIYPRIKRNRYVDESGFVGVHTGKNHAEDMQDFHLPLAQAQNAGLFTWGIVRGLEVSGTLGTGTEVTIQPGTALDVQGRLVVLAEDGFGDTGIDPSGGQHNEVRTPVALGFGANTGTVHVTIQYAEILRSDEGVGGRLEQVPWLRLQPVAGFVEDGTALILAVVEIDSAGRLAGLSERSSSLPKRRVVGQAGQSFELRRATTVDDQVAEATSAKLEPIAAGGLQLTVPNPTDRIVLARENDQQFANLELLADNVRSHGNLHVAGALQVAGAAALSGSLGIGTSTPDQPLAIQGLADPHLSVRADNGARELLLGIDRTGGVLATTTHDALHLRAGGVSPMLTIQPNGNVGIATADPSQALEVSGVVKATDFIKGDTLLVSSQWTDIADGISYTSGKVGIGDLEPRETLAVAGRIKVGALTIGAWPADDASAFFGTNALNQALSGNYALLQDANGADAGSTLLNSPRQIHFRIGNRDQMFLANSGNVGIGTTTPRVKLHIVGGTDADTTNQGGFLVLGDLSGANLAIDDNEILARSNSQKSILHFQANGGDIWMHAKQTGSDFIIKDNGSVGVGTSNPSTFIHVRGGATCNGVRWVDSSSMEYKENIAALSLDEALATLAGLDAVTFVYKDLPTEKRCVGFIAENVPDLVASEDRKGLSAMDIVGILTKVVQRQQEEIAELKAEFATAQLCAGRIGAEQSRTIERVATE